MSLQIRRGTDADRQTIVFELAEIIYVTDTKLVYIGDGSTIGGNLVGALGGSGNTIFTTEAEPTTANEGDGWIKPSDLIWKIYIAGSFQSTRVEIANLAININDGYF